MEKPIGLGIIGTGGWVKTLANEANRNPKFKIISCTSRNKETGQKFAQDYHCEYDETYEKMLERKEIEAILIASPNYVHAEEAILAAKAKKSVFIDKPITNTLEEAEKIITECEKHKVILSVGHNTRREEAIRKMKSMIDNEIIGKPVMIEAHISHSGGCQITKDHWRWYKDKCPSGPLIQLGIHYIDTLIYLLGKIEKVSAFFNKLHLTTEIEDLTLILVKFQSGVLGYLGSNYVSFYTNFIHLYGTEANLYCYFAPYKKFLICKRTKNFWEDGKVEEISLKKSEGVVTVYEELDEFANCIRKGEKPEIDGKVALENLKVVWKAIESAQTGKEIFL